MMTCCSKLTNVALKRRARRPARAAVHTHINILMSARLHVGPVLLMSQGVLNRLLLNVIQQQTLRQLPPPSLPREMLQRVQLLQLRLLFTLIKDHTFRQSLPLLETS